MKFNVDLSNGINKELFNDFCLWAYKQKASDILLTGGYPLQIKLNKELLSVSQEVLTTSDVSNILKDIYMASAPEELYEGNPISYKYSFLDPDNDSVISFRCEATGCNDEMTDKGVSLVLRTIPATPPSVEELGVEEKIINMMRSEMGIIIVSGATNSGKSTLVSSLIRWYSCNFRKHIITYEAPIEFTLSGILGQLSTVVQSEVYKHLKDFAKAIKNALRRSPDLIFIGEMRDAETIKEGIVASETGHLVISTLHASSPEQSISRMVNQFDQNEAFSKTVAIMSALRGVITQRLVNKKGGGLTAIKGVLELTPEIRERVENGLGRGEDINYLLKREIGTSGFSMLDNAKVKYSDGLITLTTLLGLIEELGTESDFGEIEGLVTKGFESNNISKEQLDADMKILGGANERR